ncbi:MAG: O-antigen ligase family protein [Armatimonadia bacterium]
MGRPAAAGMATIIFGAIAIAAAGGLLSLTLSQGVVMSLAFGLFVALVFWAMSSTGAAFYVLLASALLEALYKGLVPNLLTLLIKDIFLLILVMRLVMSSQRTRDYSWLKQSFSTPALLLLLYCLAMMFSPTTRSMLLAVAGLRVWMLWMPAFFPVYYYFRDRRTVMKFFVVILAVNLPVSIYGIVQGNIGYEHTKVIPGFYAVTKWYQSDVQQPAEGEEGVVGTEAIDREFNPIMNVRACSIHISPGTFGSMSCLLVLLSMGMAMSTTRSTTRFWCIVSALAAVGGMLASGSRAPVFGLAGGLVVLIMLSPRRAGMIASVLLVGMLGIFLLKDVTGAGADRLQKRLSVADAIERSTYPFKIGFQSALERPFGSGIATGVGIGRVFYGSDLKSAEGYRWVENEFGRALIELGLIGTFFWVLMLSRIMMQCIRTARYMEPTPLGGLSAAVVAAMASVMVQLSVGSALYNAHPGLYFWIFAAAVLRLGEFARQDQKQAEQEAATRPPEQPEPDETLPEAVGYRSIRYRPGRDYPLRPHR